MDKPINLPKTGNRSSINSLLLLIYYFSFVAVIIIGTIGCESSTESEDESDLLRVQFNNESSSAFTISNIQLQPMGDAGESTEPTGEWGDNILSGGKRLEPGDFEYFDLNIPSGDWSRYRLGVINNSGAEIMLHEQAGYDPPLHDPSITHWGGTDRTVSVSLSEDQGSGLIYISAWSDMTGIE
jgi:hypothetical protein